MFGFTRSQTIFLIAFAGVIVATFVDGAFVSARYATSTVTSAQPSKSAVAGEQSRMVAFSQRLQCALGADGKPTNLAQCQQSTIALGHSVQTTVAAWPAEARFTALRAAFVTEWEDFASVTQAARDANADGTVSPDEHTQLTTTGIAWKQSQITTLNRKLDVGMLAKSEHDRGVAQAQADLQRLQAPAI